MGVGKREMFCTYGNGLHTDCKGVQHPLVKRVHGSRFTVGRRRRERPLQTAEFSISDHTVSNEYFWSFQFAL
jgi:hypothetical protein